MSAAAPDAIRATQPSLGAVFGKWTLGVPYPLLFVAGAALGILFASFIVLFTHGARTPSATAAATHVVTPAVVAPVAWQPNVVTIRPSSAEPMMFDTPIMVEPPRMTPASSPPPARPTAKKAVSRNTARRHAGKPTASGDLLTAALGS